MFMIRSGLARIRASGGRGLNVGASGAEETVVVAQPPTLRAPKAVEPDTNARRSVAIIG
jgi:hypothetical protein